MLSFGESFALPLLATPWDFWSMVFPAWTCKHLHVCSEAFCKHSAGQKQHVALCSSTGTFSFLPAGHCLNSANGGNRPKKTSSTIWGSFYALHSSAILFWSTPLVSSLIKELLTQSHKATRSICPPVSKQCFAKTAVPSQNDRQLVWKEGSLKDAFSQKTLPLHMLSSKMQSSLPPPSCLIVLQWFYSVWGRRVLWFSWVFFFFVCVCLKKTPLLIIYFYYLIALICRGPL